MILRIAGVAVVTGISFSVLKKDRPEIAFCLELAAGFLLLAGVLPEFDAIRLVCADLTECTDAGTDYLAVMGKAAAIAVLTGISAVSCRDAGENALAYKIELAGKILILMQALPLFTALSELIQGISEAV